MYHKQSSFNIRRSLWSFRYRSGSILSAIILTVALGSCGQAYTPDYPDSEWKKTGITSLEEITLGGVPHTVLIRGVNKENPVLLVIHGHSFPMIPFAHLDYADPNSRDTDRGILEKKFVVVNYDQRGVGRTSRHEIPAETMNMKQYVDDAEELVGILRNRFQKDKIHIHAISWGSFIGAKLVERRPEWFYNYLSEGQAVFLPEVYKAMREFALREARKENNEDGIQAMESAEPPSVERSLEENMASVAIISKWGDYYYQHTYGLMDLFGFVMTSLWYAPEYSLMDKVQTLQSVNTFTRATTQELMTLDLRKETPELKVPVTFIMGEHDVMLDTARDYFNKLKAPSKELIIIPDAGHAPSADQPAESMKIFLEKTNK